MINVAIIGAGIGAEHLRGYRELPDRFKVTTLCDLDSARASAVAENDASIQISSDFDQVLSDDRIDLIDVCLPPHLHAPVTLQALKAGKHVICEKPLARSLAEVDAIEAAAAHAQRMVFPVFQYRFGHATRQLRALMEAGLAGRPYAASLEVHWNRDSAYYANQWRGTWVGESGGAVLGHAIHAHDLLCHILGPVAELFAFSDTRVNAIEVEDCAAISFRMASGAVATSSVTLGAGNDTSRLRFCFEGFTAESGSAPYTPALQDWTFIARAPVTQTQIDDIIDSVPAGFGGFAGMLEAVADALDGRKNHAVLLQDGRNSIELVSAVYHSTRTGASVSLPLEETHIIYDSWLPSQKS